MLKSHETFKQVHRQLFYSNWALDKPKGFAFIEFEEEEDADHAIDNYDDAEVYGK